MRDAYGLAWKLDAVENGGWGEALLDTYMEERRPHVMEVVAFAKSFGEVIGELDEQAARARDRRLLEERRSRGDLYRHQAIPDLNTGLIDDSSPGAGSIFPQPWVMGPGAELTRLDELLGNGFAVVGLGSASLQDLADVQEVVADLEGRVVLVASDTWAGMDVVEQGTLLADRAAKLGVTWFVVRPDRYVYATAKSTSEVCVLVMGLTAKSGQGLARRRHAARGRQGSGFAPPSTEGAAG